VQYLKQSTAFIFRIGPFLDEDDGKTAETGLSIAQGDILISKAGGAFAQTSASPTTTHDADGWYQCPLTAADTGTLGTLDVQIHVAGALPVWRHFSVVTANWFDTMFSTDKLDVECDTLKTQAKADVNAEVLDVLATDTFGEPAQGAPGATISMEEKISYLYFAWRNKGTETDTEKAYFADNGITKVVKATAGDDDTTFTRGKYGTGA
jgi:hypothetical protein